MLDLTKINKKNGSDKTEGATFGLVTIVSTREHVVTGLSTQLRMNGGYEVKVVSETLQTLSEQEDLSSSDFIIVDIEEYRNVADIEQKIKYSLPITTRKIFVGDVDSIIFCDEMKRIGAHYLHIQSQMMILGSLLKKVRESDETQSTTQKICVFGCKGGSGTSVVAWHLFQSIGKLSSLPVLLVQGHTGTPDLDLLSDQTLPRDGAIGNISNTQALKISTDEEQWNFDDENYKNFNMVIFDHNITNQIRDKLATIVPNTDFVFIVVTRELSSVRNARLIIDELERSVPTREAGKEISRNIIILNENHQAKQDELTNEDIENYLGKKIDIFHEYHKDLKNISDKSSLYDFTAKMLGKVINDDKKRKKTGISILGSLFKKNNK